MKFAKLPHDRLTPKIPEYGALPHVNGENIESGTCQLIYLNSAADDGMTSGKYLFNAGDVLYSKLRPYLRKVTVADFKGVCSADMYPIKANQDVLDSHFLSWVLVSDEFTNYANEESRRARMPKLNRDQLFAYEAPIPSLDEQRQIAAFMKDKVEQTKKIIAMLRISIRRNQPSARVPAAGGVCWWGVNTIHKSFNKLRTSISRMHECRIYIWEFVDVCAEINVCLRSGCGKGSRGKNKEENE